MRARTRARRDDFLPETVAGRGLSVYSLNKVIILGDAGALVFLNLQRSLIMIIV